MSCVIACAWDVSFCISTVCFASVLLFCARLASAHGRVGPLACWSRAAGHEPATWGFCLRAIDRASIGIANVANLSVASPGAKCGNHVLVCRCFVFRCTGLCGVRVCDARCLAATVVNRAVLWIQVSQSAIACWLLVVACLLTLARRLHVGACVLCDVSLCMFACCVFFSSHCSLVAMCLGACCSVGCGVLAVRAQ